MTSIPSRLSFSKHSPAPASLATLEEVGHPFESVGVVMHPDGADDAAFAAISTCRLVPVLASGGETIRENGAVFAYPAETYPQAKLLPSDPAGRRAVAEWVGYLGGILHSAFRLIFRPTRRVGGEEPLRAALRDHAEVYLHRLLTQPDAELTGPGRSASGAFGPRFLPLRHQALGPLGRDSTGRGPGRPPSPRRRPSRHAAALARESVEPTF